MLKSFGVWGLMVFFVAAPLWSEPIKHHPANPHYYLFNGQPTILITSAEHYGGVINKDFDYVKYFDALKAYQAAEKRSLTCKFFSLMALRCVLSLFSR